MTPIDLFAAGIHLHDDGGVTAGERRMDGGGDGWQIAAFRVATDADVHADHWEMHPDAEELVTVLRGSARLYLRPEGMVRLHAGSAMIVPRGCWHRIELDEPSELMSIGRRRGTRLERRTG
jgi:quercetin dioxygenase-like cupin family protein